VTHEVKVSEQPTSSAAGERKAARRIPPLVWIVVALLAAWFVIAMIQRAPGAHRTPSGGTVNGPGQPPAGGAQR
jgi:hypothetical protein